MARILVIAHRPLLQQVLHRTLRAWAHDPLSTCDAMRGLELALALRPDVVLVDHDAPVLDGPTLVRELLDVLRDECPGVVLVSGARIESPDRGVASLAARPTVLVRKPFRSDDLRDAIARALPEVRRAPATATPVPLGGVHARRRTTLPLPFGNVA